MKILKKLLIIIKIIVIFSVSSVFAMNKPKNPFLIQPREKKIAKRLRKYYTNYNEDLSQAEEEDNKLVCYAFKTVKFDEIIKGFHTKPLHDAINKKLSWWQRPFYDFTTYTFSAALKALDDDNNRLRSKLSNKAYDKKRLWGLLFWIGGASIWTSGFIGSLYSIFKNPNGDKKTIGLLSALSGAAYKIWDYGTFKYRKNNKDDFYERITNTIIKNNEVKVALMAKYQPNTKPKFTSPIFLKSPFSKR